MSGMWCKDVRISGYIILIKTSKWNMTGLKTIFNIFTSYLLNIWSGSRLGQGSCSERRPCWTLFGSPGIIRPSLCFLQKSIPWFILLQYQSEKRHSFITSQSRYWSSTGINSWSTLILTCCEFYYLLFLILSTSAVDSRFMIFCSRSIFSLFSTVKRFPLKTLLYSSLLLSISEELSNRWWL